ncbi:MAG: outer membrane beta-barrel protein [Bacteroidales bacterium]|nr:outer membrane beta-barrel protein [Bacteroidales bacterium]
MKKAIFAVIAMLAIGPMAKAQLYVGGSIGVNTQAGKETEENETEKLPQTTNLNISPEVGFFLSDQFAVGAYINTAFSFGNTRATDPIKTRSTQFGITPYARYYAIQSDKFGVFLEGQVFFSHQSSKTIGGGVTVDGPKTNSFGVAIVPGLAYSLTDNIQLQMRLNVLGAHFTHTSTTSGDGKETTANNSCGLNISTQNVLGSLGGIQVGFIYKF